MNFRKQQNRITELYRRGDFLGARETFEDFIRYLEDSEQTDQLEYLEALLGLGSLYQKDLDDDANAEATWLKLVSVVEDPMESLEFDEDAFDLYTQALLLLAFAERDQGKHESAEKHLKALRAIAVESRGEKSADVAAIDEHLRSLRQVN